MSKAESPWRTLSERKEELDLRQQTEAAILSGECSETWPEIWETFVSPAISKALDARDKLYVLWVKEQALCGAQRERIAELEAKVSGQESPDYLLCDNEHGHPSRCHCLDPLHWKQLAEAQREKLRQIKELISETGRGWTDTEKEIWKLADAERG